MGAEKFWWENQKERDQLEDINIGRRKTLKLISEKLCCGVLGGFIWLRAETKHQALLNMVMNLQVP
jgi:hypothetical protein